METSITWIISDTPFQVGDNLYVQNSHAFWLSAQLISIIQLRPDQTRALKMNAKLKPQDVTMRIID
jgi:hypothetical protein